MYVNVYSDNAEEARKQNLILIPSLRLIISDKELNVCLYMLLGSSTDHYYQKRNFALDMLIFK